MTELPIRPVWSLSVLYSIHSQFNLPHTPPTLHSYRCSSLSESPFHPFVAFKIVLLSAVGKMGKGSRVRWPDGRSTVDKICQKLDKYCPQVCLSFIHIEVLHLEISKLQMACLLSALFLSLSFFLLHASHFSRIQIRKENTVSIYVGLKHIKLSSSLSIC